MAKEVKWYDGCISLWHVIACRFVVCTLFPMTTVPSGNCTSVILLLITQGLIYTNFLLCLVAIRAHFSHVLSVFLNLLQMVSSRTPKQKCDTRRGKIVV